MSITDQDQRKETVLRVVQYCWDLCHEASQNPTIIWNLCVHCGSVLLGPVSLNQSESYQYLENLCVGFGAVLLGFVSLNQ